MNEFIVAIREGLAKVRLEIFVITISDASIPLYLIQA